MVLSDVHIQSEPFDNPQGKTTSRATIRLAEPTTAQEGVLKANVRFKVIIRGVAATIADLARLVCRMEESAYFCLVYPAFSRNTEVKTGTERSDGSYKASEFEIVCYLANYLERVESKD